jgi:hypothetical protein
MGLGYWCQRASCYDVWQQRVLLVCLLVGGTPTLIVHLMNLLAAYLLFQCHPSLHGHRQRMCSSLLQAAYGVWSDCACVDGIGCVRAAAGDVSVQPRI